MHKVARRIWLSIGVVIGLAVVLNIGIMAFNMYSRIPKNPEVAVKLFYEREVAEDQLMDPLILAGSGVIPLLERDLLNPDMPRRRYAITALGVIGEKSALPVLSKALRIDADPDDYIQCDVLTAIAMIDHAEGLRAASKVYKTDTGCVAEIQRGLQGDYVRWRKSLDKRTYFQALLGRHG